MIATAGPDYESRVWSSNLFSRAKNPTNRGLGVVEILDEQGRSRESRLFRLEAHGHGRVNQPAKSSGLEPLAANTLNNRQRVAGREGLPESVVELVICTFPFRTLHS